MTFSDSSEEDTRSDNDYPHKRRRRTKEDQMLGIFGSDSEDERSERLNRKVLHTRGVDFQKAGNQQSDEDDSDSRPRFGLPTSFPQKELHSRERSTPDSQSTEAKTLLENLSGKSTERVQPIFGIYSDSTRAFIPSEQPAKLSSRSRSPPERAPPVVLGRAKMSQNPESGQSEKLRSGKAAQMMARMGYKAGQGLGTTGKGIVNPLEAKLRPGQKAGLGSTNEKTDQEREEERRHGVKPEPRPSRKPQATKEKKKKIRYKTSKEIMEEAGGGLTVPAVLQNIVDMTGENMKSITDLTNTESATRNSAPTNELYRISHSARHELNSCASDWRELQDHKLYLEAEAQRLSLELRTRLSETERIAELSSQVKQLVSSLQQSTDDSTTLEHLVSGLEHIQSQCSVFMADLPLDEIALSLLTPLMKRLLSFWNPITDPTLYLDTFLRLATILGIEKIKTPEFSEHTNRHSFFIESFMSTIWYPRICSVLANWTPHQSRRILDLLNVWSSCIPVYLRNQLIEKHLLPRIQKHIAEWAPHGKQNERSISWIFQWLPFLKNYVSDVIAMVTRKLTSVLNLWRPTDGFVKELDEWHEVIGHKNLESMLQKFVTPKLAEHLRKHLIIDPANQNLLHLDLVLIWRHCLEPTVIGQLLEAEFFPKWKKVLYLWLCNDPNFEEVSEWYEWWQQVIPQDLQILPRVQAGFISGLNMMNTVLEDGSEALEAPSVGPALPLDHVEYLQSRKAHESQKFTVNVDVPEISFKDVVENWCAEHAYLLLPLRKAHETGASLFRITTNPLGIGGTVVYFRGDIIMVFDKQSQKFEATSLKDLLLILK